jgi:hypothetical protein
MICEEAKLRNIIEMAVGFTVMARVFEKGSSGSIKYKLYEVLQGLEYIETKEDFDKMHDSFCHWFTSNIKLAKSDGSASYGHAAKVLDIALKVFVYYCNLPDPNKADKLLPMLRCAIDAPIFKYLIERYDQHKSIKSASLTLRDIDEELYPYLQKMVSLDIERDYGNTIYPVQYDDILWRRLNRDGN